LTGAGFPHLSAALPQLASPGEVAAYLGLHPATIERHLREGRLPGVKVGRRWYVHLGKLRQQLETPGPPLAEVRQ